MAKAARLRGPRNPWTHPPRSGGGRPGGGEGGGGRPSLIDDLMRARARALAAVAAVHRVVAGSLGDGRSLWSIALAIIPVLWIALTSVHHRIARRSAVW